MEFIAILKDGAVIGHKHSSMDSLAAEAEKAFEHKEGHREKYFEWCLVVLKHLRSVMDLAHHRGWVLLNLSPETVRGGLMADFHGVNNLRDKAVISPFLPPDQRGPLWWLKKPMKMPQLPRGSSC